MPCLRLNIIRFVDEHQPGFVECSFTDAGGTVHTIIDKVPIFSAANLWSNSTYPQPGVARCEILKQSRDSQGRKVALVTIAVASKNKKRSNAALHTSNVRSP